MALTKVNRGGLNTGISDSSDATFLTATSSEGVTLAGTLAVTGVHTVGNNAIHTSDGGAVTQNLVQGLAKSWVAFDGGAGSISPEDSFNVGSLTDNATGNYNVNYSNSMANANFSASNTGNAEATVGGEGIYAGVNSRTTALCQATYRRATGSTDSNPALVQIFGDLA